MVIEFNIYLKPKHNLYMPKVIKNIAVNLIGDHQSAIYMV